MQKPPRFIALLERYQITPGNLLLVCLSFWLTALAVRSIIFWSVYHGRLPAVFIEGYHIHHFVTGGLLLILALVMFSERIFSSYIPLALIGCALGLMFDEFLFWTRGHFNYWSLANLIATVSIGTLMMAGYLYAKHYDIGRLSKKRLAATLVPIIIFSSLLYALFHYDYLLNWPYAQHPVVAPVEYQDDAPIH